MGTDGVIASFTRDVFGKLGEAPRRGAAAGSPWQPTPPKGKRMLADHLEAHYGIAATKVRELDGSVFRIDRSDGPPWVARAFPVAREIEVVEGDAEILAFLAEHDYPAERCAHEKPVTVLDGRGVLVTEWVTGAPFAASGTALHLQGELVGRLQTLPCDEGARARLAGSWHSLSVNGGGRRDDVMTLLPLLAERRELNPELASGIDAIRAAIEDVDFCEDLPHALIHIDLGGPNLLETPEGQAVAIDWAGAGRGPRVFSLTGLSHGARDPRLVDAYVAGYRRHAELEPEELRRLGPALRVHSLVLEAWVAVFAPDRIPAIAAGLDVARGQAEAAAARAAEAFRSPLTALDGWRDVAAPPPMEDQFKMLVDAVAGKTDAEIDAFAQQVGGHRRLLGFVFQGMTVRLTPEDCQVAFILDDELGWVFGAVDGKAKVAKRVAKKAPAIVRTSSATFLRAITRDLDWDEAIADGRLTVEGDRSELDRMFAGI